MPQAIASIITRPKGSGQFIGKKECCRIAEEVRLLVFVYLADVFDVGMAWRRRGSTTASAIGAILGVDLRSDLRGMPVRAAISIAAVGTLLRCNAPEGMPDTRQIVFPAAPTPSGPVHAAQCPSS